MSAKHTPWAVLNHKPDGYCDIGPPGFSPEASDIHESEVEDVLRRLNTYDDLAETLERIAEGCSFPADDVQRAIRDTARAALSKARGGK